MPKVNIVESGIKPKLDIGEEKEPVIQLDVIGWKVIFPDGKIWHQLTLEAAAATVMEWFKK